MSADMQDAIKVVQEFVEDVEIIGVDNVGWQDLVVTYQHAVQFLIDAGHRTKPAQKIDDLPAEEDEA